MKQLFLYNLINNKIIIHNLKFCLKIDNLNILILKEILFVMLMIILMELKLIILHLGKNNGLILQELHIVENGLLWLAYQKLGLLILLVILLNRFVLIGLLLLCKRMKIYWLLSIMKVYLLICYKFWLWEFLQLIDMM